METAERTASEALHLPGKQRHTPLNALISISQTIQKALDSNPQGVPRPRKFKEFPWPFLLDRKNAKGTS